MTQSKRGIPAYGVLIAENPRWSSPVYLHRELAEAEVDQARQRRVTPQIKSIQVEQIAAQTVSTDQFGGCTVKRTVSRLRRRGAFIYGQVTVRQRALQVRVPRQHDGHTSLWRVVP